MKIVINTCYGGFSLSSKCAAAFGPDFDEDEIERNDERLVEIVERDPKKASGHCADHKVVEIPDTATDWEIDEYDGFESIIYVVDGKIRHAH